MSITLDDLYTKIMAIEEKLDNLAKKVDEMGKSEHRYSSDE